MLLSERYIKTYRLWFSGFHQSAKFTSIYFSWRKLSYNSDTFEEDPLKAKTCSIKHNLSCDWKAGWNSETIQVKWID